MVCGSFLLAALLNRSAMEEVPTPAAPAAVIVPMSPTAETELAPSVTDCAEAESRADAHPVAIETNQAAAQPCEK